MASQAAQDKMKAELLKQQYAQGLMPNVQTQEDMWDARYLDAMNDALGAYMGGVGGGAYQQGGSGYGSGRGGYGRGGGGRGGGPTKEQTLAELSRLLWQGAEGIGSARNARGMEAYGAERDRVNNEAAARMRTYADLQRQRMDPSALMRDITAQGFNAAPVQQFAAGANNELRGYEQNVGRLQGALSKNQLASEATRNTDFDYMMDGFNRVLKNRHAQNVKQVERGW